MNQTHSDYLITPEILLRERFGKKLDNIIEQIPNIVILSFFDSSLNQIENEYQSQRFNWFGNLSQIILFDHQNIKMALVTLPLGSSLASMILEELIYCGVNTILSIGYSGAISDTLKPHDIIIPSRSIKEDGVSDHYIGNNDLAIASKSLIQDIESTLSKMNQPYHKGVCWTISTPYRESFSKIQKLCEEKVLCVDMESATLFAVAQYYKVDLASLFSISDSIENNVWKPHYREKPARKMKKKLLEIAIESLYHRAINSK